MIPPVVSWSMPQTVWPVCCRHNLLSTQSDRFLMLGISTIKDCLIRSSNRLAVVTFILLCVVLCRDGMTQVPPDGPGNPTVAGSSTADQSTTLVDALSNQRSAVGPQISGTVFADSQDVDDRSHQHFFRFDVLQTWSQSPKGFVGNANAQSYQSLLEPILLNHPYGLDIANQFGGSNYYDPVTLESETGNPSGTGFRLQTGYYDPDDSGLVIEGFDQRTTEQFDARDTLGLGRGDQKNMMLLLLSPPDFLLNDVSPADGDFILQNNLLNLRGLPLDDGSLEGVTSPYDLEFRLTSKSRLYGGSITFVAPSVGIQKLRLRSTVGVRYLRLQESFHFFGQDSGLSYDNVEDLDEVFNGDVKLHSPPNMIDDDQDGIVDNAALVEGSSDEFRFIIYNDPSMYPMTSTLNNVLRSSLIGPEIGLRYDLGGTKFKLWGQTKAALTVNNERLRLNGNNIGMVTRQNNFLTSTPGDPDPNQFNDQHDDSYLSPVFEQSLFIETFLFAQIPMLRRVEFFKNASFRFGCTFIWVGNVSQPSESIVWQGNPSEGLYPSIDMKRADWWTTNLSYSVNWNW